MVLKHVCMLVSWANKSYRVQVLRKTTFYMFKDHKKRHLVNEKILILPIVVGISLHLFPQILSYTCTVGCKDFEIYLILILGVNVTKPNDDIMFQLLRVVTSNE